MYYAEGVVLVLAALLGACTARSMAPGCPCAGNVSGLGGTVKTFSARLWHACCFCGDGCLRGRMGCRNVLHGRRARAVPASRRFLGWRQQPDSVLRVRGAQMRGFSAQRSSVWLRDSIAARIGRCGDLYVKI